MRIALLSDIHGNALALDAVLADIEAAGGADEHWVLGDLVAMGPDSGRCPRAAAQAGVGPLPERQHGPAHRHPPDLRASYVLLEADAEGHRLAHRRVDYDREAVIADLERRRHPEVARLRRILRGGRPAPWDAQR